VQMLYELACGDFRIRHRPYKINVESAAARFLAMDIFLLNGMCVDYQSPS